MSDTEKKKLDICYFKVPVIITQDEDNNRIANFKEIEYKGLCFKIEVEEFTSSTEAIFLSEKMNHRNKQALRLAALSKKDGDIINMIRLCDHDSVVINTNI